MSVFNGEISKDAANKYGRTVEIDGKNDSLSSGIRRATLQSVYVAKSGMTPAKAMQIEHGRLFKAFREAEGRDPIPNGDPAFWDAHAAISELRSGRADTATAVRKDDSGEVSERLRKRLAEGPAPDEPAWIQKVLDRSR